MGKLTMIVRGHVPSWEPGAAEGHSSGSITAPGATMTNSVNPLGQRPSMAYQGPAPAGQTPASGNTLPPQLTAGGRAELERVFAEIPAGLRSEARQLLDSGKVPCEFTSKRLISRRGTCSC